MNAHVKFVTQLPGLNNGSGMATKHIEISIGNALQDEERGEDWERSRKKVGVRGRPRNLLMEEVKAAINPDPFV
jgi:hypothetical protein